MFKTLKINKDVTSKIDSNNLCEGCTYGEETRKSFRVEMVKLFRTNSG